MELMLILLFGLSLLITQVLQLRIIGRIQALRDDVTALQARIATLEASAPRTATMRLEGNFIPNEYYGAVTTSGAGSTATLTT